MNDLKLNSTHLEQTEEGSLDKLAQKIFVGTRDDNKQYSIIGDFSNVKELFEALLMFFTKGMQLMFGSANKTNTIVDLDSLSVDNYLDFRNRFQSIGISPYIITAHLAQVKALRGCYVPKELLDDFLENQKQYSNDIPLKALKDYRSLESDKLEDYYFCLNCDTKVYIIHFRHLN